MIKWKVRFNLGRGTGYRKWKIIGDNGEIVVLDPTEGSLILTGCRLYNKKGGAKKIYHGHNKFVVAWILCDSWKFDMNLNLGSEYDPYKDAEISYNPRYKPNWELFGQDVDGESFHTLYTLDNKVYIKS